MTIMNKAMLLSMVSLTSGMLIGCSDHEKNQEQKYDFSQVTALESNTWEDFLTDTRWYGSHNGGNIQFSFEKHGVIQITTDDDPLALSKKNKKSRMHARGRWVARDTGACQSVTTNTQTGDQINVHVGNLWIVASSGDQNSNCCLDLTQFNQNKSLSVQITSASYSKPWWCKGMILDSLPTIAVDK